jgi:hypothetical protein
MGMGVELRLGQAHPVLLLDPIHFTFGIGGNTRLGQQGGAVAILGQQGDHPIAFPGARIGHARFAELRFLGGRAEVAVLNGHGQCASVHQGIGPGLSALAIHCQTHRLPGHAASQVNSSSRASVPDNEC